MYTFLRPGLSTFAQITSAELSSSGWLVGFSECLMARKTPPPLFPLDVRPVKTTQDSLRDYQRPVVTVIFKNAFYDWL